jgi:uncharacterized protein YcnI
VRRRVHQAQLAVVGSLAVIIITALPAAAHVTVNPATATKGGYAKLTFRVPTESSTASTVKLEVQLPDPQTAPIASVSVQPVPGWSYTVERTHLTTPVSSDDGTIADVVSTITWRADTDASAIKPGEFDEFSISAGPLPTQPDQLAFKALQTYSDGTVVRWIESTADDVEPDHPAPVLQLTDAPGGVATPTGDAGAAGTSPSKSDVDGARTWGIAGVVLGVLALVAAGASQLGRRRRPA